MSDDRVPRPSELRDWADNPAASGFVPIHPKTLCAIADELTRLRAIPLSSSPEIRVVAQKFGEALLVQEGMRALLVRYDEVLRAAWKDGTLPASVIPKDLVALTTEMLEATK